VKENAALSRNRTATADGRLTVEDARFKNKPIDIDLEVILASRRDASRREARSRATRRFP